jgi:FkbM family methyltransferase
MKEFLDFIEIGTSDFDTEIEKDDKKVGLSIDAVKLYVDKLKNKENCVKLNLGVSDFDGEITVNYIPEKYMREYNLPFWIKGCNSVNSYHSTVSNILRRMGVDIKDVVETDTVPCKTLHSVIKEYNIKGMYLLKIDTEGHDCVILKHFFDNIKDNLLLPHEVLFESNILTVKKDIDEMISKLNNLGYDTIYSSDNTLMRLDLRKIDRQNVFSGEIHNYYIESYPENYDPQNLPHENTLEGAKKYCMEHNYSGITYQSGRYEVRNGNHMKYYEHK